MKFITEGGVDHTVPILILGLASLVFIAIASARAIKQKPISQIMLDTLLLLGFLSFSYPVFRLIIGLFQGAQAVEQAGEISSALVWSGIHFSLISLTMGFAVLNISAIGWFILRPFKKAPLRS
ncbi:MAG: hypothetical protein V2A67_00235 [Bacteroidota bacterium]